MKAAVTLVTAAFLAIASCSAAAEDPVGGRWYSPSHIKLGKRVFDSNCMVCHGAQGQGLAEDWKVPLADGSYPPPPLNGTAHTWHHPISQLLRYINDGGVPLGGKMPGFGDKLSDVEKASVIAYFQNWWSDEIYNEWVNRGGLQ
ncbi:MAG: cytochrome c [Pseudomonadota bacterium]